MTPEELSQRTEFQRFSNAMLTMRRIMKWIGVAVRIQRWMDWMDAELPGPEPELKEGDIESYLYAQGATQKQIDDGLAKCLAIVDSYKEG